MTQREWSHLEAKGMCLGTKMCHLSLGQAHSPDGTDEAS